MPSIRAADVACRMSRLPAKVLVLLLVRAEEGNGEGSASPRSMKTSQTRSWAGKGIE